MAELIEKITTNANMRFTAKPSCSNSCIYSSCTGSCEKCLEYCHFPQRASDNGFEARNYNCPYMIDFYICKYSYKYATEMLRAFEIVHNLNNNGKINILSLGCGPCTDLMAMSSIKHRNLFPVSELKYKGFELTPSIWTNIYNDISQTFVSNNIISTDVTTVTNFSDYLLPDYLNIICINYLLSTLRRTNNELSIEMLLNNLAATINNSDKQIIIVFNDINLSTRFEGGIREYFDSFSKKIPNYASINKHFISANPTHYCYGYEYQDSNILYNSLLNENIYNPFTICGSAQKILYKIGGNS